MIKLMLKRFISLFKKAKPEYVCLPLMLPSYNIEIAELNTNDDCDTWMSMDDIISLVGEIKGQESYFQESHLESDYPRDVIVKIKKRRRFNYLKQRIRNGY